MTREAEILLPALEDIAKAIREQQGAVSLQAVDAGMNALQRDNHYWSTRPCDTCAFISSLLGRPFGCDLYRIERAEVERRRAQAARTAHQEASQ